MFIRSAVEHLEEVDACSSDVVQHEAAAEEGLQGWFSVHQDDGEEGGACFLRHRSQSHREEGVQTRGGKGEIKRLFQDKQWGKYKNLEPLYQHIIGGSRDRNLHSSFAHAQCTAQHSKKHVETLHQFQQQQQKTTTTTTTTNIMPSRFHSVLNLVMSRTHAHCARPH